MNTLTDEEARGQSTFEPAKKGPRDRQLRVVVAKPETQNGNSPANLPSMRHSTSFPVSDATHSTDAQTPSKPDPLKNPSHGDLTDKKGEICVRLHSGVRPTKPHGQIRILLADKMGVFTKAEHYHKSLSLPACSTHQNPRKATPYHCT